MICSVRENLRAEARRARATVTFTAMGALSALSALAQMPGAGNLRERLPFNADWRFIHGDPKDLGNHLSYFHLRDRLLAAASRFTNGNAPVPRCPPGNPGADVAYAQPAFDDTGWRLLTVPHDWGIEGSFQQDLPGETGKLAWAGVAWYRKHFFSTPDDRDRRVYLDIDGAMAHATVWLNGQFVGGWPYGYTSFRLDLTPYLHVGDDNIIAIRLDNPADSSRWYPGGGIYRNVWLVRTAPVHVAHWGTYVTTPVISSERALVDVKTIVENHAATASVVEVTTSIFVLGPDDRKTGKCVASAGPTAVARPIEIGGQALVAQTLTVPQPRIWTLTTPQRYVAVTTVTQDAKPLDSYETPFGIRSIAFDATRGFLLNNVKTPIRGVCNHHDLGALGTAFNVRAAERQLELLQTMGCNAIRTSHNPPAPELLDLCDRMGFLVMDEAFDGWAEGKRINDYGRLFPDWHESDLRALVRRDRNHPCVILWSIGNEVKEQEAPEAWKLSAHLAEIVRGEDRTRPVTAGHDAVAAGFNGLQTTVDVFGYNYKPADYAAFHQRSPHLPLIGSETQSTVSSRGEYFFPVSNDQAQGQADFQISSYDLSAPPWAHSPDVGFRSLDENPYVAGEFVWTGFDYLGEPTPYQQDATRPLSFTNPTEQARHDSELAAQGSIRVPSRSSYFGILDLAGFKKDRFFLYQARWRPELPMAHILPHWNWPERVGLVTPVHVYTSGDEAELFLNGASLGRKKREPLIYRLRWDDVRYSPGELRVVAYRNGVRWAEDVMPTAGPPAKIVLSPDRRVLRADGSDLAFITAAITDVNGVLVPRANNLIRFKAVGAGEIVATDNGDATSFESFQTKDRHAYNGLALLVVRTLAGNAGAITISAESDSFARTELALTSNPSAPQ